MSSEPQVPPELAGFLQQLRSLVPPPNWGVNETGDPSPPQNAVVVVADDREATWHYLRHLAHNGQSILAQVEQVLVGLAQQINELKKMPAAEPTKFANGVRGLAPDSCAEDALFALMQYLLSLRGIL